MGNKGRAVAVGVPRRPRGHRLHGMGITAEKVAEGGRCRARAQDAFARTSHQKALAAQAAGEFRDEITPCRVVARLPRPRRQRHPPEAAAGRTRRRPARADTSAEGLGKLRPVFQRPVRRHRHRRQLVADERRRRRGAAGFRSRRSGLRPGPAGPLRQLQRGRRAPGVMGIGPIAAIPKALRQAGLTRTSWTGSSSTGPSPRRPWR